MIRMRERIPKTQMQTTAILSARVLVFRVEDETVDVA